MKFLQAFQEELNGFTIRNKYEKNNKIRIKIKLHNENQHFNTSI